VAPSCRRTIRRAPTPERGPTPAPAPTASPLGAFAVRAAVDRVAWLRGRTWSRRGLRALAHPGVIAALIVLIVQMPLHAGWLMDPGGTTLANPFHGTHAWAVDVVGDALRSGSWPDPTDRAGFPALHRARFVGWAVLVVGAIAGPIVGAVAVVNLSAWVGPALGAGAMVALARRLEPEAHHPALVLGGVVYGLAPVGLGAAMSGQVENAQAWVLPLLLLAVLHGAGRWRRAPLVALVWTLGALTSPYLGMAAAAAAVWLGLRIGVRRSLAPAVGAMVGIAIAGLWLDAGAYDPSTDLFKPSFQASGWPDPWGDPPAVADLTTLFTGATTLQARAMVVHQTYLGMAAAAVALLLGRRRAAWAAPVLIGVVLALGPELGIDGEALELDGRRLAMPAMAARWLDLPLAHGGQYYRFMAVAWLGWAGMIATCRLTAPPAVGLGLLLAVDSLRTMAGPGLPWPTVELPAGAWTAWAEDPVPGGVAHVPAFSPALTPNRPVRLAGGATHGRPVSDMPRAEFVLSDSPSLQTLDRCTRRGQGCAPPSLATLGAEGFRFAVLDLPAGAERTRLRPRLEQAWGAPAGTADGLTWWACPPPGQVP
jgi:hypothetical protein